MTLYGTVLFIHVVAAIALVGGSTWAHVSIALARRTATVHALRGHLQYLHVLVKATGPLAAVTGLAGLYLTFSAGLWGTGWPVVALVLFAMAGGTAGGIVDPSVARLKAAADDAPDGPVTGELQRTLADPRLTLATWLLAGADLAIVFLMTNKPGWSGSVGVAVAGLVLGAVLGLSENRRHRTEPAHATV